MPVYDIPGLTDTHGDNTGVVEVGRIRKGETSETKSGASRPKNLDYFRVTFREDLTDLKAMYDRQVFDKPKTLQVQLAYTTIEECWWAWNSIYKSGGMVGLHDGVWWNYLRDPETNDVLVSDYMLTPNGHQKITDDMVNGHRVILSQDALDDYLLNYHKPETPFPKPWQKVQHVLNRMPGQSSLLVNRELPVYTTGKKGSKGYKEHFAEPEGRLFVTMPQLEGFTSNDLFQLNTGSSNDIRTLSGNLGRIVAQNKVFETEGESIGIDALPMLLVRRKEIISKPIGGKRVKSPEWLVHIKLVPKWQRLVDEMQLRMTVQKMYAAVNHEFSGLSQTIDKLELPEPRSPLETETDPTDESDAPPLEGEIVEEEDKIEPEPEPTTNDKKPQKTTRKTKLKPRPPAPDVATEVLKQTKAMLSDENIAIDASEFWGAVYGLGYDQAGGEQFLTSEDWRACLAEAVADYEANHEPGTA